MSSVEQLGLNSAEAEKPVQNPEIFGQEISEKIDSKIIKIFKQSAEKVMDYMKEIEAPQELQDRINNLIYET